MNIWKIGSWVLGIAVLLFLFHLFLSIRFGNVDYENSLRTRYFVNENDDRIISTHWAEIETERRWIHISLMPDCPGYVGSLISWNGVLDYDYGMFTGGYIEDTIKYVRIPFSKPWFVSTRNNYALRFVMTQTSV